MTNRTLSLKFNQCAYAVYVNELQKNKNKKINNYQNNCNNELAFDL